MSSNSIFCPSKLLVLDRELVTLCTLQFDHWKLYLYSLEPTIPNLSELLEQLATEFYNSSTTLSPFSFPLPVALHRKFTVKRKNHTFASEEILVKQNAFILATIFYLFHRNDSIYGSVEVFGERKSIFLKRYFDILSSYGGLTDSDLYYLVNFEFVICWIYQNIFSFGKQMNQEYLMVAAMALEGSHKILSRGGGSGNYRRLREEIYRRVTGRSKQKRMRKQESDVLSEEINEEEKFLGDSPVVQETETFNKLSFCSTESPQFHNCVSLATSNPFPAVLGKRRRDEADNSPSNIVSPTISDAEDSISEPVSHWKKLKIREFQSETVSQQ